MNDESQVGKFWKWVGCVFLFALGMGLLQAVRVVVLGAQAGVLGVGQALVWSFVGELLIAVTLVWVISKTHLKRWHLAGLVWLVLFIVQQFDNMLEGFFFTNSYSSVAYSVQVLLTSLLTTFAEGVLAAVLFQTRGQGMSLRSEISSYFAKKSASSWIWRIVVGSVAYFPIYFFFGMLITPFIMPYYNNSSLLRIPSFTAIIPLEFFRGFLYVLSMLGVFAVVKATGRTLSLLVASILYVPGALVPLMLSAVSSALPLAIIPFHLTEILADSVVYGVVLAHLFANGSA